MRFQDRYNPSTEGPKEGFYACLGLSEVLAQEIATAYLAGTGAGMPDTLGVLAAGTVIAGSIVMMDPSSSPSPTWVPATSPDVSAVVPKPLFFVHEGDTDLTGRMVGRLTALRGLARFHTTAVSGSSFSPGDALVASSGSFALKSAGDHLQVVGWVGPDGYRDGRLDVIFEACCWG